MFYLIWQEETIDEFDTQEEAEEMQGEYNLAFGGGVAIADEPLSDWE